MPRSGSPQPRLTRGAADLFNALSLAAGDIQWAQRDIRLFGRLHKQPRLTAWYGDPGMAYTYSGVTLDPLPWTPTLEGVREDLQRITGETFNSALLNLYRDNQDSMGMHSDDEPELGPAPVIASLSLGETRTLTFKHKAGQHPNVKVPLSDGSLMLMKGATQRNWKHGINKTAVPCGPRINLTFRRILSK